MADILPEAVPYPARMPGGTARLLLELCGPRRSADVGRVGAPLPCRQAALVFDQPQFFGVVLALVSSNTPRFTGLTDFNSGPAALDTAFTLNYYDTYDMTVHHTQFFLHHLQLPTNNYAVTITSKLYKAKGPLKKQYDDG